MRFGKVKDLRDEFYLALDKLRLPKLIAGKVENPSLSFLISRADDWLKICFWVGVVGNVALGLLFFLPFKDMSFIFIIPTIIGIFFSLMSVYAGRFKIDLESRVQREKKKDRHRKHERTIKRMYRAAYLNLSWIGNLPVLFIVVPLFRSSLIQSLLYAQSTKSTIIEQSVRVFIGNEYYTRVFMLIPIAVFSYYSYRVALDTFWAFRQDTERWLQEYRYRDAEYYDVFNPVTNEHEANVVLGKDYDSEEPVRLNAKQRTNNLLCIGAPGSGKSATIALPMIAQDLENIVKYIKKYKELSENPEFWTSGEAATYINGLIVVEPSNDLCQKVLEICKAINFPEELICYLNPQDPKTDTINLLAGPIDKVAESLTKVIAGIASQTNDFFSNSLQTHLKMHIYLLKLSAIVDTKNTATFQDLIHMYSDIEEVVRRARLLKQLLKNKEARLEMTRSELSDFETIRQADEYGSTFVRGRDKTSVEIQIEEMQREISTIILVDRYFDNLIQEGEGTYPAGHAHAGQQRHIDSKEKFVEGLKVILDDISNNIGLQRTLFNESRFDMDAHMRFGGLLIVNTDIQGLGRLSNTFGKFMSLYISGGVFRRTPNLMPIHPVYYDEHPEFMTDSFKSDPAQSRKYNVPFATFAQSFAQYSEAVGDDFMQVVNATLRNKIGFGDAFAKDAELLSNLFGEHQEYKQSYNSGEDDMDADLVADRKMRMARPEMVANISPSDIATLDPFVGVGRILEGENDVRQYVKIDTSFINVKDYEEPLVNFEKNPDHKDSFAKLMRDKELAIEESKTKTGFDAVSTEEFEDHLENLKRELAAAREEDANIIGEKNFEGEGSVPPTIISPKEEVNSRIAKAITDPNQQDKPAKKEVPPIKKPKVSSGNPLAGLVAQPSPADEAKAEVNKGKRPSKYKESDNTSVEIEKIKEVISERKNQSALADSTAEEEKTPLFEKMAIHDISIEDKGNYRFNNPDYDPGNIDSIAAELDQAQTQEGG